MMIWPLAADGALKLTADTTGAAWVAGFLRRPSDGSLVATLAPGTPAPRGGYVRDANGALAYSAAAATQEHNGFALDASNFLATTAADPAPTYRHHGLKQDSTGRVYVVVNA
jgi:hypothetical protein